MKNENFKWVMLKKCEIVDTTCQGCGADIMYDKDGEVVYCNWCKWYVITRGETKCVELQQ